MRVLAGKLYKRVSLFTLSLVLAISGLAVAAPLYFSQVVHAGPSEQVYIDKNVNGFYDLGDLPFPAIQVAVNAANSDDTIVATAGTYNERIIIDKPLILTGAGAGQSIIDATSFGTVGNVIDITGLTGNVKIEGFDIKTGTLSNGVHSSSGTDAAGKIEILNNRVIGNNDPAAGDYQFGIIAGYGDVRTLVITGNQISNTYNNSILVERQLGETEITNNMLDGAFPSIFFMTYNGNDITTLQKVDNNTIDMVSADPTYYGSAITFNSARRNEPSTSLGSGKYTNISIVENIIINLSATSLNNYKGIYLVNDDPAGTGGETTDAVISGNQISGATGNNAVGIKLSGKITGTVLSNNTINDLSVGLLGTSNNNGTGTQYPSSSTFSEKNSLSGNTVGVDWPSQSALLNATNNWWGDASGPNDSKTLPGSPNYNNPSGTGNSVSSYVDYRSWYTDAGMATLSSASAITQDATNVSLYDATLNGTNGSYDATGHSFWVSHSPIVTTSPNIPSGVYSTPDFGNIAANADFSASLSSLTTSGIPSNMPAITPNTTYYYVAWSLVDGTWYPGEVKSFTTTPLVAPILTSPSNNAIVKGVPSLTNSWFSVPSAVKYIYESYNDAGAISLRWHQEFTITSKSASNVKDTTFWWRVKAVDAAGNESDWSPLWKVTVDNTVPVGGSLTMKTKLFPAGLTVTSPTAGVYTLPDLSMDGADVFDSLSVAVTDANLDTTTKPAVSVDGTLNGYMEYNTSTNVWDYAGQTVVPDFSTGTHNLVATFSDTAGNTTILTARFTTDNTAPIASLIFPTPGSSSTSFEVQFSEAVNQTDAETPANYFLNNWPGAGGSGNLVGQANVSYNSTSHIATITFTTPGWYISPEQQWGVQGIHDLAGNIQSVNPYSQYSTPMVKPVTTDSGTDSDWHNSAVTVSLSCADVNGSGCKNTYYTTDGSTPTTSSTLGNSITLNSDGIYTIKYLSIDNAGNEEIVKTAANTVKIDKINPTTTLDVITSPTGGTTNNVDITGTVSDANISSYQLTVADSTNNIINDTGVLTTTGGVITPYDWDISALASGTYTVTLTATDVAGNTNSATQNVVIDNTAPVIVYTSYITDGNVITPDTAITGYNSFSWAASPSNPSGATYNGSLVAPSFTVIQNGNYAFTLTAVDALGNTTSRIFSFTYTAPVFTPALTITPTTPAVIPEQFTNVETTPAEEGVVLGDQTSQPKSTTSDVSTTDNTDVKGATDTKNDNTVWSIFGLAWYWWLLIIVAIASAWWIIAAAIRRNSQES